MSGPQGMGSLWARRPTRGRAQHPVTLNLEPGRVNGYIYNGTGYSTTMTVQNQFYQFTFNTQVPNEFQSQVTLDLANNRMTVNQSGWCCLYYCVPATGLEADQTYQSAVHVNGVPIGSGFDTITGVTSYTFGAAFSGPPSPGQNSVPYYNLTAGDVVDVRIRCTSAANKSFTVAVNASDFNPMSFQFACHPWSVRLANQECTVETSPPGRIFIPTTDDYFIYYNSGASNSTGSGYDFVRITRDYAGRETRRLYGRTGMIVNIDGGSWVDLVAFKQNPSFGSTSPPWTPNSSHFLEVVTARSSGL